MATIARISRRLLRSTVSAALRGRAYFSALSAHNPIRLGLIVRESDDRVKCDYRVRERSYPWGSRPPRSLLTLRVVLVGQVAVYDGASVWNGAVLRGDLNKISVGFCSNVQECCIVHAS